MKKASQNLAAVFLILTLILSCSDDDTSSNQAQAASREVEYKLTVSSPLLTRLSYANAAGAVVNAPDELNNVTTWSKKVEIPAGTYTARLQFEANTTIQYSMEILIDGVVKNSRTGTATGESDYELGFQTN